MMEERHGEWEGMQRIALRYSGCLAGLFALGWVSCAASEPESRGLLNEAQGSDSVSIQDDGAPERTAKDGDSDTEPSETSRTEDTAKPPSGEAVQYLDLAYTPPAGVVSGLATLDVHRIDDGEVRPLVLMVHGGSWAAGDKGGFAPKIVPWWLEQGYVAAPVNFRLASKQGQSPEVKPLDQARDIAAALAWLLNRAGDYGIATEGVVLLGYSSGAHLVALLGSDESYLQEAGLNESQVAASISLDVHAYDVPYALQLMEGSVVEGNISTILHLFGQTEAEQLVGSPISYVDGWAARALIISVDEDLNDPTTHGYIVDKAAARYVAALTEAGHMAEAFHDSNETHSSLVGGFGEPGDPVTATVKAFLDSMP